MPIKINIEGGIFQNCGTLVKTSGGAMTAYFKCKDCGACMKIVSNDIKFQNCASCGNNNFTVAMNGDGTVPDWFVEPEQ